MAHLLLAIAQHPRVQDRVRREPGYLDAVIDETMRVWPLFGIAHRITTAGIDVSPPITAGSVVLFDYPGFQGGGDAPAEFDPDRWQPGNARPANFIPFGVSANRPCPARGVAPIGMRACALEVLRQYTLSSSAGHTRSLANRAPAYLAPVGTPPPPAVRLAAMRLGDRWEDVWRSLVQLLLGTFMVWDARRLALCRTYFAQHPEHLPVPSPTTRCPRAS
jgi:hypothetical protein